MYIIIIFKSKYLVYTFVLARYLLYNACTIMCTIYTVYQHFAATKTFPTLNPELPQNMNLPHQCQEKFGKHASNKLIFGASVVLPIDANISIFVRVGSSSTRKSWKSPYDPYEGVGATEHPIQIYTLFLFFQYVFFSFFFFTFSFLLFLHF